MGNKRTPLPPSGKEALHILRVDTDVIEHPISRGTAVDALANADFSTADAKDTLEMLELRGYIYDVDGRLRITGG